MHNLIPGNCLELLKDIPEQSIDFICIDPPYGTTKCKWDIVLPFEPMWEQITRIRKPKGAVAIFGTEPFSSLLRVSNLKEFKYDWVWDKVTARGHLVAKKRPMQQTELISIFYTHDYYPQMIDRPPEKIRKTKEYARTEIMGGLSDKAIRTYDQWYPKNLIQFSNAGSSNTSEHPTQKPLPLLEYLIKTYTQPGDTVLDFVMGSGTTGVAAKRLGREFIGMELDKKYFEIAKRRIGDGT